MLWGFLFYQLTRLTRERGALGHDDRLDALSMAVAFFVEVMDADAAKGITQVTEDWLQDQMENPIAGYDSIRQSALEGVSITWEYDQDFD